ncbi:MAG: AraC family transcriptional regulator [Lachnospiraceae bacterium]|nr:AraC family transcriptional regulator [Lachnospiraceae bacterium]
MSVQEDKKTLICMEDFSETSMEITLVHVGREACKPYHGVSGTRDEYIIHFILSGNGFYSANGNTWSLGPGQMFLIRPDEPVVYCSDTNNPWFYVWIGFKGIRVDTILKNCGFSKNHLCLPAPSPDKYMNCFDELFEHQAVNFSEDLYRESILLKLFAILVRNHNELAINDDQKQNGYSENTYVNLAIDYINKMYMQGIGVSDIADSIGITRSHLNHVFQKELNISIQNFLIDFRLHKSANLLVSTAMSIKEISDIVGYNDQLVFSKAFKKKFGMSPKSYRASQNEDEKN